MVRRQGVARGQGAVMIDPQYTIVVTPITMATVYMICRLLALPMVAHREARAAAWGLALVGSAAVLTLWLCYLGAVEGRL